MSEWGEVVRERTLFFCLKSMPRFIVECTLCTIVCCDVVMHGDAFFIYFAIHYFVRFVEGTGECRQDERGEDRLSLCVSFL